MPTPTLSATALKKTLRSEFVGKDLLEVPTPSAVLDISKVKRNCTRMLDAVDKLQFLWRSHIKTHKVPTILNIPFLYGAFPSHYFTHLTV
jgi:D-serine deaminase-like pyridoxal phosphate-dependent protein